jgi:beta-xylosidase
MIEAAMIWNEPNNKSHWDPQIDPTWEQFATMAILAGQAIRAERSQLPRVLGGISPIDPGFIRHLEGLGVLAEIEVLAVHGFPLDWNLWQIHEWPQKLDEIKRLTRLPVWVTEVGVSSFGAEDVQAWGVDRTAELLIGQTPRIHWYSLYDLPREWGATTRHKEAEGSSYYRHFYMGLLRQDGTPKAALDRFAQHAPALGICQWFHFEDHRLDDAVAWLKRLGVRHLRTGLSWADSLRPNALAWFDRQMAALEDFDVTVTFCFTPESRGIEPHHTSAPQQPEEFAEFCARMIARYAPAGYAAPAHSCASQHSGSCPSEARMLRSHECAEAASVALRGVA